MPTAYNYTRLSTTDQLKGEGLHRQDKAPKLWIDNHPELNLGLDTTLNMRDLGISAFRGDNAPAAPSGHSSPPSTRAK